MSDKLQKWLQVSKEVTEHMNNANAAQIAHIAHLGDRCIGVERVVDRHLERIQQRESDLADFCQVIAESPALNLDLDEEEE